MKKVTISPIRTHIRSARRVSFLFVLFDLYSVGKASQPWLSSSGLDSPFHLRSWSRMDPSRSGSQTHYRQECQQDESDKASLGHISVGKQVGHDCIVRLFPSVISKRNRLIQRVLPTLSIEKNVKKPSQNKTQTLGHIRGFYQDRANVSDIMPRRAFCKPGHPRLIRFGVLLRRCFSASQPFGSLYDDFFLSPAGLPWGKVLSMEDGPRTVVCIVTRVAG